MTKKKVSAVLPAQSVLLAVAMICHESNRAYCASIGDSSQDPWQDAPEWQRESAINGVTFHCENPDAGDAASHDNWMAEKLKAGWTYGETKDAEKKTHPCLVPFEDLPAEQQFKDRLFRSLVHAMIAPISEMADESEHLRRQLAAQKGQTTKARNEAEALAAQLPVKPRKFELPKEPLAAAELVELIADADDVELVLIARGGREIEGLAPMKITGNPWKKVGGLVQLTLANVPIVSPVMADMVGYVLLVDGDVAAARPRPDVLKLRANQRYQLAGDVIF